MQANYEVVLAAVSRHGAALQYASRSLCNSRDIVLAAVTSDGAALRWASASLREDVMVCSTAIHRNPDVAALLSDQVLDALLPQLLSDKQAMLEAVQECGAALQYASPGMRADRAIVLAAVTNAGWVLEFASSALQADKGVVLAACRQDGDALQWASEALRADPQVVGIASAKSPSSLQWALTGSAAARWAWSAWHHTLDNGQVEQSTRTTRNEFGS